MRLLFSMVYGLIALTGLSGNGLIIFIWWRFRSVRTACNYLILSLSLSDFFMEAKVIIFLINAYYGGPYLGIAGAKIYGAMSIVTGFSAIWSLSYLTLERAWVIGKKGYQGASKLRIKVVIIGIWSVAIMVSLAPLLGWNRYTYEGFLFSSTVDYLSKDMTDMTFNWMLFSIGWLTPSLVIIYSHLNILRANRTNNQALFRCIGKTNGSAIAKKNIKIRRLTEQKLLRVCIVATCVWFISWTPYAVVFILPMLGAGDLISPNLDMVPAVFCKLAAAVNPIIYGLLMPKFVLCAKRLFRIGPSQGLVRNVKCLRRKRALSDTFFELGPINMAENWSANRSFGHSNDLKIKSKSTGNLYCVDSERGNFSFDMKSLDLQFIQNQSFWKKQNPSLQRTNLTSFTRLFRKSKPRLQVPFRDFNSASIS